jgi:hypothetical protein
MSDLKQIRPMLLQLVPTMEQVHVVTEIGGETYGCALAPKEARKVALVLEALADWIEAQQRAGAQAEATKPERVAVPASISLN